MAKIYVEGIAEKLKKRQARVKSGDTLSKIALEYTGDANNWRKILEHNGLTSDKIKPDQVIDVSQHLFNPEFDINEESVRLKGNKHKESHPNLVEINNEGVARDNSKHEWKNLSSPIGRGNQSVGNPARDVVIQYVKSPILSFPVQPSVLPTPVQPQARLEVINPGNITLDRIIRESGAQPGDTIVMPNNEEIKYVPGNTTQVRTFNVGNARTYDADPAQQYLIPGFNQTIYGYGGKYTPPVNPAEVRDQSVVYPYAVSGQPVYKTEFINK